MKEHETIADIIAEIRRQADKIERNCAEMMKRGKMISDSFARELVADIRRGADRLEAAWKRERAKIEADALTVGGMVEAARKRERGDCAKLREAIAKCVNLITEFGNAEIVKTPLDVIIDIEAILKAALAAPPRNCDLPEVAKDPWRAWLDDKSNWDEFGSPKLEIHDWLLAPATEKEGGAE